MKSREDRIRNIFFAASILLVAGIVLFIINFRSDRKGYVTRVGAVCIGVSDDNGWNESHFNGIMHACEKESCRMYAKMSVPEEKEALKTAVSELVGEGCSVVFLTSYGYGAFADEIADLYPNTAFYCISGDFTARNCMSYFARIYQVRYLAGIVAGSATESGLLGYVTAMPIPETIRSINAYALGARRANPLAKVIVEYTGSWDDKDREEEAVKKLAEEGVDVMTFHEDRPYAIDLADEMGLYSTGYDYVSGDHSERFLTAAVFNWDMLYSKVLNDYLSGRANFSSSYWLGLADGAVSLYPYSELVTGQVKDLVNSEEERIKSWRDVFSGEIYDNEGMLRCRDDERIGDDELFNSIDWYVEGVEVRE